ncbi:hypothetical protein HYPSUDRAFT_535968 [Hypholoma sublateritium FD-334 SS-4]|uniref:Uncharacterized protein n=1 Tax=Hypholoma sublateritium (strain FD-334 SS-4) TaxID=945553 RepID=A0A0D2MKH6_HYPSF|nr:hypothetical protein HYPSUDRAFT_535968 [Hypholoma sublateritium FD-334 SS-4]
MSASISSGTLAAGSGRAGANEVREGSLAPTVCAVRTSPQRAAATTDFDFASANGGERGTDDCSCDGGVLSSQPRRRLRSSRMRRRRPRTTLRNRSSMRWRHPPGERAIDTTATMWWDGDK